MYDSKSVLDGLISNVQMGPNLYGQQTAAYNNYQI